MNYRNDNEPAVRRWAPEIHAAVAGRSVPPSVIAGLMTIESGGNPRARSPMNYASGAAIGRAHGLMQVMPFHFPGVELGPEGEASPADTERMLDVMNNLGAAVDILERTYAALNRWDHAAAAYFGAYNWSERRITTAQDVTGTDGPRYVALFEECRSWFRDLDVATGAVAPLPSPSPYPPPFVDAIAAEVAAHLGTDASVVRSAGERLALSAGQRAWSEARAAAREAEEAARRAGARLDQFAAG